jgi:hypothetical protein
MTKAPGAGRPPLRRLVHANGEPLVLELTETLCTLRPIRARRPLLQLTWGQVVLRGLDAPRARGRRP